MAECQFRKANESSIAPPEQPRQGEGVSTAPTQPKSLFEQFKERLGIDQSVKKGIKNDIVPPNAPARSFSEKAKLQQLEKEQLGLFEKVFKAENRVRFPQNFPKFTDAEKNNLRETTFADREKLKESYLNTLALDKKNLAANVNLANIMHEEGQRTEAAVLYQRAILNTEPDIRANITSMLHAENFGSGIPTFGDIVRAREERSWESAPSPFVQKMQEDVEDYIQPAVELWTVYGRDPALTWLRNSATYSFARTLSDQANQAWTAIDDVMSGRAAGQKIEELAKPK